jgi:hypothetical protein
MEKYINNGNFRITNPQLQPECTFSYVGNIELFDFNDNIKGQQKNFNCIENLLNSQNIYFTEINIVKWNSKINYTSNKRCKFIITTSNPELLWYKYDTEAPGGSNNIIYYKNKKIKVTSFINLNEDDLFELLNE